MPASAPVPADPPGCLLLPSRRRFMAGAALIFGLRIEGTGAAIPARIVTIGADLTEIAAGLVGSERIVGCDRGSRRPPEIRPRAILGYSRALSAEGVLALRPDLILASSSLGPEGVDARLREAGLTLMQIETENSVEGILAKIARVGEALGLPDAGPGTASGAMAARVRRDAGELRALTGDSRRPRLLFIVAADAGMAMAAGDLPAITAAIALAGAENAGRGWRNVKPISREALVATPPDGLIVMQEVFDKAGGAAGLLAMTGFGAMLQPEQVFAVDAGPLMLFGPSTPEIALDIARRARSVPAGPRTP